MYKKISLLLFFILLSGCEDSKETSFGQPCNSNTICSGVCNLGLPDGMCTIACDDANPCSEGACVDFTQDISYCMPECSTNDECRENYSCVDFLCVPRQPLGAGCDDNQDCLSCNEQSDCSEDLTVECVESVCANPCEQQSDCSDGTICAKSEGNYWCVGIYFQQGPGTAGSQCGVEECAAGFSCIEDHDYPDGLAFCSNSCIDSRDCPPEMVCRNYNGSQEMWCLPRTFCEECGLDFQCGYESDKCVAASEQNATSDFKYCSRECDPEMSGTCPPDNSCLETFYCNELQGWVTDCEQCQGECSSTSSYQCISDYGTCLGEGEVCSLCYNDSDCQSGLDCIYAEESEARLCLAPCQENRCADNYYCHNVEERGDYCFPRSFSCFEPSGEKDTCGTCNSFSDCLRGECVALPGDTSGFKYCVDYCDINQECGHYTECIEMEINSQLHNLCVPDSQVQDCTNYTDCMEQCPDGSTECNEGPVYCQ